MDKKLRINIQVGESKYPIWVEMDEEPLFREAARMINRRLVAYNTKFRGANLPSETILAMAAIDLAVNSQKLVQKAKAAAAGSELADIVADLQQFAASQTEQPTASQQSD